MFNQVQLHLSNSCLLPIKIAKTGKKELKKPKVVITLSTPPIQPTKY